MILVSTLCVLSCFAVNKTLDSSNSSCFVVVIKLDIDTSWIEVPLANQILESPELLKLVDAFYFEHHVHLLELRGDWGGSMSGSIYDSIKLFTDFRKAGVDAHFWV